ncbi:hypothetical protein O9929_05540 [Vibrio lentus]|nr:hypothetical protein [Vibrio lentus]
MVKNDRRSYIPKSVLRYFKAVFRRRHQQPYYHKPRSKLAMWSKLPAPASGCVEQTATQVEQQNLSSESTITETSSRRFFINWLYPAGFHTVCIPFALGTRIVCSLDHFSLPTHAKSKFWRPYERGSSLQDIGLNLFVAVLQRDL